jgi:uncharacterized protein YbaR (Trm112 family)
MITQEGTGASGGERGFGSEGRQTEDGMAVSKELLDILVCPLCKTPVTLTGDQQGLKCRTCRRIYPIRGDIPVMLVDEARIEAE